MDAEEREDYDLAMVFAIAQHNPKYLKRWKFSRTSLNSGQTLISQQDAPSGLAALALHITKGKLEAGPETYVFERAKSQGRRVIYMDRQMNYYDLDWKPTERNRGPLGDLIIKKDPPH